MQGPIDYASIFINRFSAGFNIFLTCPNKQKSENKKQENKYYTQWFVIYPGISLIVFF